MLFLYLLFLLVPVATASDATGTIFAGEIIREIPDSFSPVIPAATSLDFSKCVLRTPVHACQEVTAVVTTIYEPSFALKDLLNHGICLVVVTDRITPEQSYLALQKQYTNLILLDIETQECVAQHQNRIGEFAQLLKWRHFGRKNLAYLYAMSLGARHIWDFDDDNILTDYAFLTHTSLPIDANTIPLVMQTPVHNNTDAPFQVVNPYPYFEAPHDFCWPRGFPLSEIRSEISGAKGYKELWNVRYPAEHITVGVIQCLADTDPDVDAIFRFTNEVPFKFPPKQELLLIPSKFFTPFNAQATLWMPSAYFGMLLPISVPGRVADIWRSYFDQTIMSAFGIHVAFKGPIVYQNRNAHDYRADFQAELDLYLKTETLLTFLTQFDKRGKSYPELVQDLYLQLFRRGYLEWIDVELVCAWLQAIPTDLFPQAPPNHLIAHEANGVLVPLTAHEKRKRYSTTRN